MAGIGKPTAACQQGQINDMEPHRSPFAITIIIGSRDEMCRVEFLSTPNMSSHQQRPRGESVLAGRIERKNQTGQCEQRQGRRDMLPEEKGGQSGRLRSSRASMPSPRALSQDPYIRAAGARIAETTTPTSRACRPSASSRSAFRTMRIAAPDSGVKMPLPRYSAAS